MNGDVIMSPGTSGGILDGILNGIRCIELIETLTVPSLQKVLTSQNGHELFGALPLVRPSLSLSSFHHLSLHPGGPVLSGIPWPFGDLMGSECFETVHSPSQSTSRPFRNCWAEAVTVDEDKGESVVIDSPDYSNTDAENVGRMGRYRPRPDLQRQGDALST
jgi:hypothetical protein